MGEMMILAEVDKVQRIALPKIGAGYGGLRWQDVKSIIEKVAVNHQNVDLYIVENFVEHKEL
jgi:O-acetyl-ADP-ribose deacetylase (regulator of RNase III)